MPQDSFQQEPFPYIVVDFSDVVATFKGQNGIDPRVWVSNFPIAVHEGTFKTEFVRHDYGEITVRVWYIFIQPGTKSSYTKVLELIIDKNSDFLEVNEYIKRKIIDPYIDFFQEFRRVTSTCEKRFREFSH